MRKVPQDVPWWFWAAAAVPGLVACTLLYVVWQTHVRRGPLNHDMIGMAAALYAAVVLLGYLLLVLCGMPRGEAALPGGSAPANDI